MRPVLVMLAILFSAGCSVGSGIKAPGNTNSGNANESIGTSIGVLTTDFVILDLSTGQFSTSVSEPADLVGNDVYRTTSMVFRRVPVGTTAIGTDPLEFGGSGNSDEVRGTATPTSCFLGVFEVTQAQWKLISGGDQPWNAAAVTAIVTAPADDRRPASMISRVVALAKLGNYSSGKGFILTLPKETQWECAARAGTTTDFTWGTDRTKDVVKLHASVFETQEGLNGPRPVGVKQPNAFGFYDMAGNIAELTLDGLGQARGGSWYDTLAQARPANRIAIDPAISHPLVGLRLVIVP